MFGIFINLSSKLSKLSENKKNLGLSIFCLKKFIELIINLNCWSSKFFVLLIFSVDKSSLYLSVKRSLRKAKETELEFIISE